MVHQRTKMVLFLSARMCWPIVLTVNLHKGSPPLPPTVRKARLRQWRKHILRARGGGGCRGNVLLCPKSDEGKKCLVLFVLLVYFMPTPFYGSHRDMDHVPYVPVCHHFGNGSDNIDRAKSGSSYSNCSSSNTYLVPYLWIKFDTII